MKNTDSSQNVACALREYRWGKTQGGRHSLRLEAALGKEKNQQGTGGPRSLGGQDGLSGGCGDE